ncbi:cysteine proteinase inhibitor 3-like [Nymphaea colorata]|uniref:cysteine proteinase inhibitor 3-like n=1 Tax=Nymphaea colorata TaxID=210225 RepID=UPI00129EB834|nr:cysteine proteinase inhibitor 3-like [Nymphaea colorata]
MASSNSSVTALGGFHPVQDVKNNKHVQELGKFAVAEFNKKHHEAAALVFVEVVEAQSQVVAGTNYRLLIKALKAGYVKHYKALVYEKPWENVKTLPSFEPGEYPDQEAAIAMRPALERTEPSAELGGNDAVDSLAHAQSMKALNLTLDSRRLKRFSKDSSDLLERISRILEEGGERVTIYDLGTNGPIMNSLSFERTTSYQGKGATSVR